MTMNIHTLGPLVDIRDLTVRFGQAEPVLHGVSLQLSRGECLALVGESGSGKSVTARTLAGLTGKDAHVQAAKLAFQGVDLRQLNERAWQQLRGASIGFVMQDALGALDPLRRVGAEIEEPLHLHTALGLEARRLRVLELLRDVGVPEPELRASQYPWQLSGGLRQRALIASAIACNPRLIIADEPTTALDATVQAQVIALLESLRGEDNALLMVSHDLSVVSRLADRVAVMRHGVIVEEGSTEQVLQDPRHPYTQLLLRAAKAVHFQPTRRLLTAVEPEPAPQGEILLEARELSKTFIGPDGKTRTVLNQVSLQLRRGETLGVVGESGCGKTTLTRLILGLEAADAGEVWINGQRWSDLDARQKREARRAVQVVFQDPLSSFDPRYTVQRVLFEALVVAGVPRHARRDRALELLELVRLDASALSRRPIELSGGQRQRIAIARALASEPQILICDEPVSALDVSVQAQILELLDDLKRRLGLACLFISHDLGVINHVSERVLVMKAGEVVESGSVRAVFDRPAHAYTRALIDAIPTLETDYTPIPFYLNVAI
ncbi:MAG: ABC transporter ATP-binding protein [Pseudomonas sp.]|jgi:peptide/nickel transport system ATP-binding protein|uniref:dipeptide ABC transporter ATP-binding protein n=1 Tax=Pseudomonas sp. TaxID=306 RepID=UPI002395E0F0|nr:ABC transporter ATP-binding protein [Pseudomonas sp.]MDP9218518.1 ABC transporter ATP-binding protein [Pseudomonadota bacterium]MDE1909550.1 ABC transporter ATP-binding protein [Pseudomonas sp.]MDE2195215.1 ABC transporter ATP-binding protein [Pseudomonas sp.]MDE2554509.1 ABC transporter ATP-binding protein [Pseudomonas sp.]MDP9449032.1 ABC transporter ATP-binding protein [Pseudomonadota bacterium]